VLFNILEHPVAADVVLMSAGDAVETSMVADNCSTKLGDVVFKVD
jgi:hypothetical protein